MDLLSLFRSLPRPNVQAGDTTFRVILMPGYPSHRLGKDPLGAPVLLLHATEHAGRLTGPVILQHIIVQHNVTCRLSGGEDSKYVEDGLTLVRCASGEPTLRDYFVRVAELAVRQLGNTPTRGEVNRGIKRLTELFRAFEQPSRKSIQGLWAELLVIAYSTDPAVLIGAWRVDPEEAFDFADGANRTEVKSFSGRARVHNFSLRQARPGLGVDMVVASVRTERSGGGATITDLMRVILGREIPSDLALKLNAVVAQTLGDAAATGLSIAFDLERARESLYFFDMHSIPSVNPVLPPGVLNVRFDALMDDARTLPFETLRDRGMLLRAATPGR